MSAKVSRTVLKTSRAGDRPAESNLAAPQARALRLDIFREPAPEIPPGLTCLEELRVLPPAQARERVPHLLRLVRADIAHHEAELVQLRRGEGWLAGVIEASDATRPTGVQNLSAAEAAQVVLRERADHTAHVRDLVRELLARGYRGKPRHSAGAGPADPSRREAVLEARLRCVLEDDAFVEVGDGVFRLVGLAGEVNDSLEDMPRGPRGQPTHHEVRRQRQALGLNTGTLAFRAGIDRRVLEYIEAGLVVLQWRTADRLRVALRREGWRAAE